MGCSASKDDVIVTEDQHSEPQCKYSKSSSSSRLPRNLSLPPKSKCDNHLVFLTSTTYGFLGISTPKEPNFMDQDSLNSTTQPSKSPKICDSASFSPHSVINTWELMEGLDEFTSDFVKEPEVNDIVEYNDSKPLWQHLSVESLLSKMDPNVDSSYRKALRSKRFESSEVKDVGNKGLGCEKTLAEMDLNPKSNKAMREIDLNPNSKKVIGQMVLNPKSKKAMTEMDLNRKKEFGCKELHERSFNQRNRELNLSAIQDKIVLYYTSMRGIRKTYQDCCEIRMILRDYGVFVDERDTSVDPAYRKELQDMLKGKAMILPQVFVKGEYIGGVKQIRHLHETGYLGELLKVFPSVDHAFACERCGEARFVLCPTCNGSRKVFEENKVKMRCFQCNENGLLRCPSC